VGVSVTVGVTVGEAVTDGVGVGELKSSAVANLLSIIIACVEKRA